MAFHWRTKIKNIDWGLDMKVAHIVPILNLESIKGRSIHMCLAPIARQYPEYKDFYTQEAKNGSFVIFDNGAFEGEMLADDVLLDLALEIGASELVVPDHLGDAHRTLDALHRFLDFFNLEKKNGLHLLVVPQGNCYKNIQCCLDDMQRNVNPAVSTIGLSYKAFEIAINNSRLLTAPRILTSHQHNKVVHLLGISKTPIGIAEVALFNHAIDYDYVKINPRSVDTSIAACLALNHLSCDKYEHAVENKLASRSEGFFELKAKSELLSANIDALDNLLK